MTTKTYAECQTKLANRSLDEQVKLIFEWTKTGHLDTRTFRLLLNDVSTLIEKDKQYQIMLDSPN